MMFEGQLKKMVELYDNPELSHLPRRPMCIAGIEGGLVSLYHTFLSGLDDTLDEALLAEVIHWTVLFQHSLEFPTVRMLDSVSAKLDSYWETTTIGPYDYPGPSIKAALHAVFNGHVALSHIFTVLKVYNLNYADLHRLFSWYLHTAHYLYNTSKPILGARLPEYTQLLTVPCPKDSTYEEMLEAVYEEMTKKFVGKAVVPTYSVDLSFMQDEE